MLRERCRNQALNEAAMRQKKPDQCMILLGKVYATGARRHETHNAALPQSARKMLRCIENT